MVPNSLIESQYRRTKWLGRSKKYALILYCAQCRARYCVGISRVGALMSSSLYHVATCLGSRNIGAQFAQTRFAGEESGSVA